MLALIDRHADSLIPLLREVAPQASGIMPSEMLAFLCLCRDQQVTHVIESGRKFGYSTEVLACCLPECTVTSWEHAPKLESDIRLIGYRNLTLLRGNPLDNTLCLGTRTALLLDGPKGPKAYGLFSSLKGRVVFGAIHDLPRSSEYRSELPPETWYTDDAEYVAKYGHLDDFWVTNGGYESRNELTLTSFGLGVFKGGLWRERDKDCGNVP